jgi:hypothetical protein
MAEQPPIFRYKPVVPLEAAEFDIVGLAGARQRVMSTL